MSEHRAVYSRIIASAEALGDAAPGKHRFTEMPVLLTADETVAGTGNGATTLVNAMRLLSKVTTRVDVCLPARFSEIRLQLELDSERRGLLGTISFPDRVRLDEYPAILTVGSRGMPALPATLVNSNGWLVRFASDGRNVDCDCSNWNPIGALAAASLGVGEVFKRLIQVKDTRGRLLGNSTFSLYTYECGGTDPGPALPGKMTEPLVLVGAGAIGNGIIEVLRQLRYGGKVIVIDQQKVEDENAGTCLLVSLADEGTEKAAKAEAELKAAGVDGLGLKADVADIEPRLGDEVPFTRVVLNALDNIPARHAVQRLFWSDLIIDGAVGTFLCQVGRHPWGEDVGCLMCCFREPEVDGVELAAEATGLSAEQVRDLQAIVTEDVVVRAREEKQVLLRKHIGKPLCAIVPAAIAQQISERGQAGDFEPSTPFVACFSACMVMTEAVSFIIGAPSPASPRFQFDFLVGPQRGEMFAQHRRPDCLCVRARAQIEKLRSARSRK